MSDSYFRTRAQTITENGTIKADSSTSFNSVLLNMNSEKMLLGIIFVKNVTISNLFFLLFIKSRSIIEIFTDRSVSRSIKIVNQFQMIFLAFNITFVNTIIGTNCLGTPCPTRKLR